MDSSTGETVNKPNQYSQCLAELNSAFKYTPGGNVQAIWRKHGWVPPTEYRNDYLFKQNRESMENNDV